jgi:hypothetical protein
MSARSREHTSENVVDVLSRVLNKGVKLWSENGSLRYKAPKGALSSVELERLAALSDQIVMLLERSARHRSELPVLQRRGERERIPLSRQQLQYWTSDRLDSRSTIRTVAFATRITGRLNIALLQTSLTELVRRHEALRTRIVVVNGAPEQCVDEPAPYRLDVVDLTRHVADRDAQIERLIREFAVEPVNVAVGPLFATRLLELSHDEHVLVVALEHIVADGYSLDLLMRDLFAIYSHGGHAHSLAPVAIQLADHAVWQQKAQAAQLERRGACRTDRLAGCSRLRSVHRNESLDLLAPSWARMRFSIDAQMKSDLLKWSRAHSTTIVLGTLTAFAALVLRWYDASDAVIPYQTDGRFSPLLENSIGYFAAVLPLRVQSRDDDTFLDLLSRLTEEYCVAFEHADLSCLDSGIPLPPYAGNPAFNWVPHALGAHQDLHGTDATLTFSPVPFAISCDMLADSLDWDHEPVVLLQESKSTIEGTVVFSARRVASDVMRRFQRNFLLLLRELVERPEQRIRHVALE